MRFSVDTEQLNRQAEKLLGAKEQMEAARNLIRAAVRMLEEQSCSAEIDAILFHAKNVRRTTEQIDELTEKLRKIANVYESTEERICSALDGAQLQGGVRPGATGVRSNGWENVQSCTTELWSQTATFQRVEPWLEKRIWEAVSHGDL